VKISGVLKDGAGKPVQNCTIQLKAKRNSTTVVANTVASENPDEAGRYSMDVEYGQYSVILLVEGFPPSHAGTITVYEDSQPGTLNDFLGAMTEDDARPEALRRFELMVEEVARNASAVAQNTAEAAISASQAEEFASNASEYALNKFTFYKTPSDPDGTIAGLAATTSGQSFRVAEGPGATAAFKTYENQDGVAILQASQPGTAAITGTIREFPTLEAAQADADAGNILSGSKCWVTSAINTSLADEYVNTSGVMTATGRTIISQYSLSSSISREATRRKNGDYQDLIEFKSLDDTALPLPENSVLEFLSLATTTDVNTNFYRLVFSSLGSEVASLVFPGTNTQYSDGKFWSAYRLFRFQDLKYVSILETTSSVVRVRYDLPAGFGVPVAGSNYIALDITGKFYPAQAGSVNSVTRKSISGTAIANAIQFVVTIAELTAAGYTASTVVDYINSIAPDCLFAA
ncbi:TPA: prophage tail fiber N-terminal domain-containing protein, partial [Escherichia coli]